MLCCSRLVGYVTTVELISMVFGRLPLPMQPVTMLEPFRIANQYGLFAVMTRGRYEIEFQGSRDGQMWTAYPFRFKPQALDRAPGSTRLINRVLSGTCGSPPSVHGNKTRWFRVRGTSAHQRPGCSGAVCR